MIASYNFFLKKNISYVDYFNIFFKYKIIQNINWKPIQPKKKLIKLRDEYKSRYLIMTFTWLCLLNLFIKINKR